VDLYRWRWYSRTFSAAHSQRPHAQGDDPEERETEEEWSTAPCFSSKALRSLDLIGGTGTGGCVSCFKYDTL